MADDRVAHDLIAGPLISRLRAGIGRCHLSPGSGDPPGCLPDFAIPLPVHPTRSSSVSASAVIGLPAILRRFCPSAARAIRSEEHTSELQSRRDLVCRLLLEKKKIKTDTHYT